MKRAAIVILAVLACFSMAGCSMLERSYVSVQPHSSSYYESEDRSVLRAETYQDLVNDLLLLIGERAEEGAIWLYAGEELSDVTAAVERACQEVQEETPLGSYAVEYMTYTVSESTRAYVDIRLTIDYRRSAEEMAGVVNITGVSALRDLLDVAAGNGAKQLAVQPGSFYGGAEEVYTIVSEVAANHESSGHWQVNFYPNEAEAGIVEILLSE